MAQTGANEVVVRSLDTEIEVKFLHVDHDVLREKLAVLGAVRKTPMRLMRRVVFDNVATNDIDGMKEIETTVGDFEAAVEIIRQLGLDGGAFQESKRESWVFGDVQIELDEWPWLDPYIEIEAPNETLLRETATLLGFDMSKAVSGEVSVAYRDQYPHLGPEDMISAVPEVKFGAPLPDLLKSKIMRT